MTLKSLFPEFDPKTDADFKAIWDSALFVFDTNALIDLYEMEPETRKQLFAFLENEKLRLWMPYQVAYEYRKNRHKAMRQQIDSYNKAIQTLEEGSKTTKEILISKISLSRDELKNSKMPALVAKGEALSSLYASLEGKVKNGVEKFEKQIADEMKAVLEPLRSALDEQKQLFQNDPTLDSLTDLFDTRIGNEPTEADLDKIFKQGDKRYKDIPPVPPGYKDAENKDKLGNAKFGDYVIWSEILEHAKNQNPKPHVILINNEKKEDWVENIGGQIRPRKELVREFFKETKQQFWLYPIEEFMKAAAKFAGAKFTSEAIADAAKASEVTQQFERADIVNSQIILNDTQTIKPLNNWIVSNFSDVSSINIELELSMPILAATTSANSMIVFSYTKPISAPNKTSNLFIEKDFQLFNETTMHFNPFKHLDVSGISINKIIFIVCIDYNDAILWTKAIQKWKSEVRDLPKCIVGFISDGNFYDVSGPSLKQAFI